MPTVRIPLTTYLTRSKKPNRRYGSPAALVVNRDDGQVFARVTIDKVPLDAVISSAILEIHSEKAKSGTVTVRAYPITSGWKAGVRWKTRPDVGSMLGSAALSSPGPRAKYQLDVTMWAQGRSRRGLMIDTLNDSNVWLSGSAARNDKPVLVVTYTIPPDQPGGLKPDGGVVSSPAPVLSYNPNEEMTSQRIEFSTDGSAVSYASAWLPATDGHYDPAADPGANPVLTAGQTVYWRVTTRGPNGESATSDWAFYTYRPLPTVTITAPSGTVDDGTPELTWTASAQTSFKVDLKEGSTTVSTSDWTNQPGTRGWTPSKGVKVPDGVGRFVLSVRDQHQRVAAVGAPTVTTVEREFRTVAPTAETAVDTLTLAFDDPVPVISGTRATRPDEIGLYRDGVQVPLWDSDGDAGLWMPASEFFVGTRFTLRDYTADLRREHVWRVAIRNSGSPGVQSSEYVKARHTTRSVWLLDPRTGDKVEVQGLGGIPAVKQSTTEESILHLPLNGDLVVESTRRRLVRSTRFGSIEGVAPDGHEETLEEWALDDSGLRYRLIFGKINWPVIIGDYSPSDMEGYSDVCDPGWTMITLNWWQRLADY